MSNKIKSVIIQGSSRSRGNTNRINKIIKNHLASDLIDLNSYSFSHYDYEHKNKNDDFLMLMRRITKYDLIIFSTPVYWYSMSGTMKTFLDRITDALKIEKETGRKLRGKCMAAICCGSDSSRIEGFFVPFYKSAEYLGMKYLGSLHSYVDDIYPNDKIVNQVLDFAALLESLINDKIDGHSKISGSNKIL